MEQSIILTEDIDEIEVTPAQEQLEKELVPDEIDEVIFDKPEFCDEVKSMIQILPKSQMREFQSRLDKRSIRADDTDSVLPIAERILAASAS